MFAAHRAWHEDGLPSQHPCEALAYCSGGAPNGIRDSNTWGRVPRWDAFAAHHPCEALAYCYGGAPTEIGDSNTWCGVSLIGRHN